VLSACQVTLVNDRAGRPSDPVVVRSFRNFASATLGLPGPVADDLRRIFDAEVAVIDKIENPREKRPSL